MNANAEYVVGLDGGGTKTIAQLADRKGKILSESRGGPSNFQIIGVEESARVVIDLVETCCRNIGCNGSEIGSVVAGLAGAGRPSDQQRMMAGLRKEAQGRGVYLKDIAVESDARIALEGAFLGDPGIIVIAGTGSIVYAMDSRGRTFRAGGWGRLIGDEGGGYHIGQEAFHAVAKMMDGRGEKTLLRRMIGSQFGFRTQEEIISAIYRDGFDVATAAPLVFRAAGNKDGAAMNIVSTAASELVETVRAVVEQLERGPKRAGRIFPVAFIGSLLESDNSYSVAVRALVRKRLKNVTIENPVAGPSRGALLMALKRIKKITPERETPTVN